MKSAFFKFSKFKLIEPNNILIYFRLPNFLALRFKERLLNLLQIRENEWWLVRQLFFQQFYSGAGIALFFTSAFALFLQKFGITQLPKILIASSFALWLTGVVYEKLEHHIKLKWLILYINIFIAVAILVFRIVGDYTDSLWFYFLMLVWYNVLYLLSSLDFWGLASLLFDVRQSKRLFGIISAGDIPAKFVGYSAAVVIAPIVGTSNLLVVGAGMVLCSLFYWNRLRINGHLDLHIEHSHEHKTKNDSLLMLVKNFFQNNLVLNLAILSFLIMSTFTIINFTFYSEVKSHVHDDLMLATYIGSFLAFSRGIAIVMKLFFTNRITNALGIRGSLLITPVALILLFIPIFIFPTIGIGNNIVILVFGLLSITNDVLRSSIQTPVFLTVMQPLRVNVRLRAHNIVKGVMDPFAFFFCGVLLLAMLKIKHEVDLMFLCYVLAGLLMLSVAWIFIVDKEYVKMLLEALKNRYFSGKDANLQDSKTLEFLADRIITSEATEAIVILNFVKDNSSSQAILIIQNALKHQSVEVVIEAVKTIERLKVKTLVTELNQILKQSENHRLLCETVKAVYAIDNASDLTSYINESNNELKAAAIVGMLRNEKSRAYAQEHVLQLANSGTRESKLLVLAIMQEAKDTSFANHLLSLLKDENEEIVLAAIKTAGYMHVTKVTIELLNKFIENSFENEVLEALTIQGSIALDAIEEVLTKSNLSIIQQNKLIAVIGRCNTNESKKILLILLQRLPLSRIVIINALYQSGYKSEAKNNKQFESYCNEYLFEAAKIVNVLDLIESDKQYVHLKQALNLELIAYRNVLLNLFSFMYPSEKINQVRSTFQLNKKDGVANALEIIDVTVIKDLAQKFIAVYDTAVIHYKVLEVKKAFGNISFTLHDWFNEVLNPESIKYNSWTKSCAVYEIRGNDLTAYRPLIKQLLFSSNPMVKQTAEYVLSNQ